MQRWGTMVAAVALGLAGPALGQGTQAAFVFPKEIRWGPAPPNLPAGAQLAVLQGDPTKSGPFVVRLMVPGGYKIPAHWHSQDEQLTVISGALYLGMGDHYDPGTARGLPAGGFHYLPAKAHHFAYAKKPTVVQINGNGPFDITYINPGDAPKAKP